MTEAVNAPAIGDLEGARTPARCPACDEVLAHRLRSWLLWCPRCGLWRSLLNREDRLQESRALDERRRASALAGLRRFNYERMLALLAAERPLGGLRLLDVGCAHGWFLQAARESGIRAVGVEPDRAIAAAAIEGGERVWVGYFPAAVPPGERFDVVTFNDVLEHIVDLDVALRGARRLLGSGGSLLVSAPDNRGAVFRVAVGLGRLGSTALLDRLWQRGYPSPHVSYFSPGSLSRLAARHGFVLRRSTPLHGLAWSGLWDRLHMDRRPSPATLIAYVAMLVFTPISRVLPSDQFACLFVVDPAGLADGSREHSSSGQDSGSGEDSGSGQDGGASVQRPPRLT